MKPLRTNTSIFVLALMVSLVLLACENSDNMGVPHSSEAPHPSRQATVETTPPLVEIPTPGTPAVPESMQNDMVQTILRELTKQEYGGRNTGSEGILQAARYLAGMFETIGLMPWESDLYIQTYHHSDPGIRYFPGSSQSRGLGDLSSAYGYNIAGVIPGKDRTRAIIVSAHYDAIGGGAGAFDNASGVAAMMRIAVNVFHAEEQPETDLVFCAFDGEELMFLGSQAFVLDVAERYHEMYNINIDSIGLRDVPLYLDISASDESSKALREDFAETLIRMAIPYMDTPIPGQSDEASFIRAGIPAILIGQFNADAMAIMHTDRDVLAIIDIPFVETTADAVTAFISNRK